MSPADKSCRIRRTFRSAACFGLATLILITGSAATPADASEASALAEAASRQIALRPDLPDSIRDIDGRELDLGSATGDRGLYLKFWATWCGYCREQMPHLEAVSRSVGDELMILAVNLGLDDSTEQIRAFRDEYGLLVPVVRDDGTLARMFSVRVTPQHVVIDRTGKVVHVGHSAGRELDRALDLARGARAGNEAVADPAYPSGNTDSRRSVDAFAALRSGSDDGRETVVVFSSPWCESYLSDTRPESAALCRRIRERLQQVDHRAHRRWIVVASGIWASEADIDQYRKEFDIEVPILLDRGGALFDRFDVQRMPTVIIVNSSGDPVRRPVADEWAKL